MKKRILAIDDEQTIGVILENFLAEDYEVITKRSGAEALDWLETLLPDLIISDIQMEPMDGFQLLQEIRTIGYMRHTPVIMLSGRTESSERIKCYQMGAQDYLTKPFNPEELKEVVKKNLFPIHFAASW
ncbi:response regulator [Aureitalea marina]|uniref:Two-component system response regulator n=1 Tax=Aureitalea marina TaxID=930804 RepID=A0A2S7KR25_9FLAO|nr:response regulator [Aureitalea marina]PQB05079.1 two-component system response regulator [Aureitalea marina]